MNFELWSNPLFKLGGKKIILFILMFLFAVCGLWGQDYTWNGTGTDWGTAANWTPLGIPGGGDWVYIPDTGTHPVIAGAVSVDRLTLDSGATITGAGNFTINGIGAGTTTIAGDISLPGNTVTITADDIVIDGSVNVTTGTIDITTTGNLTGTGAPALTADTIDLTAVVGTIGTSGALPLRTASGSAAAAVLTLPQTSGAIYVDHTGDLDGDFSGHRNTPADVSIIATGDLSIGPRDLDVVDNNITLQGATVTTARRLYVGETGTGGGVLTLTATGAPPTITANSSIYLQENSTFIATGDFTLNGWNFELLDGSDATFSGDLILNNSIGTTLSPTSTITMTGTGDLSSNFDMDPVDLIIDGDVTLISDIVVDDLTVNLGGTLDTGVHQLDVNGTTTNNGSMTISWDNGGAGSNWSTGDNWNPDGVPAAGESITFNAGDTVTVDGNPTVNDLTLAATANIGFSSSLTVTGNLNSDATVNTGTNNIDIAGAFNLTGGTFTTGANIMTLTNLVSGLNISGGTLTTVGNTMNLYASLNISGGAYNTGDSDIVFDNNNCDINLSGGTLSTGNNTITVRDDWVNTGGTFTHNGDGTVVFARPAGAGGVTITSAGQPFFNISIVSPGNHTATLQDGLDVDGSLTIGASDTLVANGQNINVAGDWTNSGTFTAGGALVTLDGNGDLACGGVGSAFNDLTISGAVRLTQDLFVTGDLTITGSLDTNGFNITVGGSWNSTGGTFTQGSGTETVTFNGGGPQTITSAGESFNNLVINSGGTVTLTDLMDVDGDVTITAGTLASGGLNMTVGGDWSNSGAFSAGAGRVTFDGAGTTTISGTTTFNDFYAETAGQTIDFGTTTTTVGGNFRVTGTSGSLVSLTGGGAGWTLDNTGGTATVQFADISNSTVLPVAGRTALLSVDTVNNTNWNFGGTFIWDGGAATSNWADNANWDNDLSPGSGGSGVIISIPDTGGYTVNNVPVSLTVATLTVGTTNTLDLTTTGTLTRSGAFTNNGTVLADESLTLAGAGTYAYGASSLVTYSGAGMTGLPLGNSYHNVTFSAGTWVLNGILTVDNNMTVSGATITGTTFNVGIAGNLAITAGAMTSTTGNISVTGSMNLDNILTITGAGVLLVGTTSDISGTLTNGTNGSTLTGGVTNSGTINAGAGGITIGSITLNSGTINGDAGGVAITGAVTSNNGGTINVGTTAMTIGTTLNNASGIINGDAGGVTITGAVTSNNAGNINLNGAGNVSALSTWNNTAGTITFTSTGNLNVVGNFTGGGTITGVAGTSTTFGGSVTLGTYTAAGNTLIFNGGPGGTFTSNGQALNDVTVNSAGTVTTSGSMDVNGNLALAGGILTTDGTAITCAGDWNNTGGTFTQNGETVTFDGTGTITSDSDNFYSVTLSGGGTIDTADPLNATRDFTITGGTIFNTGDTVTITRDFIITNGVVTTGVGDTLQVGRNFTLTAGSLTLGAVLDINRNLTLNGGTLNAAGFGITVGRNWTNGGGTFNHGNNIVTFDAASGHTITPNGNNFYDIIVNSAGQDILTSGALGAHDFTLTAGTVTLGGSINLSNNLNIAGGQTFDTAAQNFTVTGTLSNDGTLQVEGTQATQTIGTMDPNSGLVQYNGAAGGNVGLNNFFNLEIVGAGAFTLPAKSVLNDFTLTSGAVTMSGLLDVANDVALDGGSLTTGANPITVAGNWSSGAGTFVSGTGTVTFDGTGTQDISSNSNPFFNLTINSAGATIARLQDNLDVNGSLTIAGTDAMNLNNRTATVASNWTNNGTPGIGTGTVTFDGAAASTSVIAGTTTFNNLTCTTAGKTLQFTAGTTQTIGGSLTVTGDGTLPGLSYVTMNSTGLAWSLRLNGGDQTVNGVDVAYCTIDDAGTGNLILADSQNSGNNDENIGAHFCVFNGRNFVWDGGGADDNWSTAANWNYDRVPNQTDNIQITNVGNQPATVDAGFTWADVNDLNIASGTMLLSGKDLDVNGTFTNSATLQRSNNRQLNLATATDMAAGGTVEYVGSAAAIQDYGVNDYFNLTIDAAGFTITNGGALQVDNDLTVSGGTLATGANTIDITRDLAITAGSLTSSTGSITVTRNLNLDTTLTITGAGVLGVTGTTDIAGTGTFTNGTALSTFTDAVVNAGAVNIGTGNLQALSTWSNSGTINFTSTGDFDVNGNFTVGGTLAGAGVSTATFGGHVTLGTYSATNNTLIFDGGANQNFDSGGQVINNFTVNNGANTLNITTNLNQAGTATLATTPSSNINVATGVQWTLGNNLTIPTGNSLTLTANATLTDGLGSSNVIVNGTGVFNVTGTSTVDINDLTLNGTANVDIGTGIFSVNNLTVNNGTLDFNGDNVGAGNSHTVTGDFSQINGTVSLDTSALTINGDYSQTGGTPDLDSGTIIMAGASANTIEAAGSVFNLTINDEVSIINQDLDINGDLNLAANFLTNDFNITIAGDWVQTVGAWTFTAGTGRVTFDDATTVRNVDHTTGDFNNVTISDNCRIALNGGQFRVTGTLTIGTAPGFIGDPRVDAFPTYLDLVNYNFNIATLVNNGALRLHGTQTTANGVIGAGLNTSGWVEYHTGSATLANTNFADMYNVRIASGTYTLGQAITILGDSGDRDTNGNDWDDEGLFIIGGSLTDPEALPALPIATYPVATNPIIIHETFYVAATATFTPGGGDVRFEGSDDWYIDGDVTFFRVTIDASGSAAADKNLYLNGNDNITINANGVMYCRGESSVVPPIPLDPDPEDPTMMATTYLKIRTVSGTLPRWNLRVVSGAELDMQWVCVWYSDGTYNNFIVPPNDTHIWNCIGWNIFVNVLTTETVDIDGNGKLDHLRITADVDIIQTGTPFSDFTASVSGYDIAGYVLDLAGDSGAGNVRIFYIQLSEKSYLDTGVTPTWVISQNTSLRDSATYSALVQIPAPGTAGNSTDTAPPVIGYTLAIATKNEIFIHFSEPICDNGGNFLAGAFNTGAGGGVLTYAPVTGSLGALREVLITTSGPVSVGDITGGVLVQFNGGVLPQDLAGNAILPGRSTHRVSDLGLGIVADGIIEPVVGRDQTSTAEVSGVGICNAFDGSDWLKPETMTIQIFSDDVGGYVLDYETSDYLDSYKNNGVWLPNFSETDFSGLAAYPYTLVAPRDNVPNAPAGVNLLDFLIDGSDSHIKNGVDFEFYLDNGNVNGYPLYYGRVEDDGASDWYRHVGPWKFKLRDIIQQKGGISILHNIFDPTKGEKVSVHMNLDSSTMILIQVFDLSGGLVRVIQRGTLPAGENIITWDGRNNAGNVCARGVYFVRVNGKDIDEMRKVLIKK